MSKADDPHHNGVGLIQSVKGKRKTESPKEKGILPPGGNPNSPRFPACWPDLQIQTCQPQLWNQFLKINLSFPVSLSLSYSLVLSPWRFPITIWYNKKDKSVYKLQPWWGEGGFGKHLLARGQSTNKALGNCFRFIYSALGTLNPI